MTPALDQRPAHNGAPRPAAWRRVLKRYPQVLQRDQSDCAAACLAMITAHYGSPVGVDRLRDMANVDTDGASLWSVARAAEALGFHARGLHLDYTALQDIQLPAIAHWDGKHYIVVYEVRGNHVVVADPGIGRKRMSKAEFLAGWSEKTLELIPARKLTASVRRTSPWRRFLPIAWSFKAMLAEMLAASLLLSLLGLGLPLFTQIVIDRVLVNGSADFLDMLFVGMLMLAGFKAVIASVRQLILVHVSTRFDARLIGDFLRHAFELPMRFFEVRRVGDLVSRVAENEKIRAALSSTIPGVCLDAMLAAGYFALLASYDLALTAAVAAVMPVFALLMWVFTPVMRRNMREEFKKRTEATTCLIESVGGIATVKSMAAEPPVRWKLESLYIDALRTARRGEHIATAYASLAGFVQTASAVLFLWLGAHQVLHNAMTAGELLAFVTIAASVMTPVLGLATSWDQLQEARNAAERLGDVLESRPEQDRDRALLSPQRLEGHIRLENVRFSYAKDDDDAQLAGIDVEIRPGETVAVVGRSGSGKSTLMKLILGLHHPTRGRVLIDGLDLRTVALPALRRRMGVVPQDVVLFSGTIRENIALGAPDVSFATIVAAARSAGAHEFIGKMAFGYDTKVGQFGSTLSGGERQRIALARALLHDPDVLLLDEATSALDAVSERAIQSHLEQATRGRTTVVIAHRMSTVRNAHRILVMDGGRIVEDGPHEELVRRGGLYAALVGGQLSQ